MSKELSTSSIHSGHRLRLKERVQKGGLDSLADHEVLELLLGYCIPYKDTNPIAHKLIDSFGSLGEVFGASERELTKIDGVSAHTAFFLSKFPQMVNRYNKSVRSSPKKILNLQDALDYFYANFTMGKFEDFYILCLDAKCNLIKAISLNSNNPTKIVFDIRDVANQLLSLGTVGIVLFHTHPGGDSRPTDKDIASTKKIVTLIQMLGITVYDHLIIGRDDYFSFKNGKMIEKYQQLTSNIMRSLNDADDIAINFLQKPYVFGEGIDNEDK